MVEDATVKNAYQVVQVQIIATQRTYDYAWRGAEPLKPGDWVKLPGNVVSADGTLGRVASTNPPSWKGELKEILERTPAPDPWKARFSAVRSREEASRLWHLAKRDKDMTKERLQGCVDAANQTLEKLEDRAAQARRESAPQTYEPPF